MRIAFWTILLSLIIASVFGMQISDAQVIKAFGYASDCQECMQSGEACKGLPYSGKYTITYIWPQTDGTSITKKMVELIWRDAEGRTRHETIIKTSSGTEHHVVIVYDPINRVYLTWGIGSDGKKASITPYPEYRARMTAPAPCPTKAPQTLKEETVWSDPDTVKLPPETINGLPVIGTRITHVTPARLAGKDHDITTTNEFWRSPDLMVVMRQITDQPSMIKMITELSDIVRSDPDPALFKMPEGYQIHDYRLPASTSTSDTKR